MTSKWATTSMPGSSADTQAPPEEEFVVLLLHGKNSFGDKLYAYVKITLDNLDNLKIAILGGKGFNPSDFGTIVAAGKGEPTDEVRAEVASVYPVWNPQELTAGLAAAPIPQAVPEEEKKAWDEY